MTRYRFRNVEICAVTLALISACSSTAAGTKREPVAADAGETRADDSQMDAGAPKPNAGHSNPTSTATGAAGASMHDPPSGSVDAGAPDASGATAAADASTNSGSGTPATKGSGGSSAKATSASGGAGGAAGTSASSSGGMPAVAMGGSGGTVPVTTPDAKPPCLKKPSEVVLLGDGYIKYPYHTFPEDLAAEVGSTYRDLVRGGDGLLAPASGLLQTMAQSYAIGVAADKDIIAVIMTGGGDDIFFSMMSTTPSQDNDCKNSPDSPTIKACQDVVAAAVAGARSLLDTMASDGVKDVVLLGYPHIPSGGLAGMNPDPLYRYLATMMKPLCDDTEKNTGGKLRCHYLDLVPIFDGHPDWYDTSLEHYYPNAMGGEAMAKAVAKELKDDCIAQDPSSGCCAP